MGLMLALGLIAMLTTLAVPGFSGMMQRDAVRTSAHRLLDDTRHARTVAVLRQQRVVLRAAPDGWSRGWQVFIDDNGDGRRQAGELVLRRQPALPEPQRLNANAGIGRALSYTPRGTSRRPGGGLQMGSFTLCPGAAADAPAYRLVVSATGRPRLAPAEPSNHRAC